MVVKLYSENDMHANTMWQVEALDPREIAAFTADAGYKTSFIPAGIICVHFIYVYPCIPGAQESLLSKANLVVSLNTNFVSLYRNFVYLNTNNSL
jgi:hypothetical protein